LCAALGAGRELNAAYRRLLKMTLEELRLLERQSGQLDEERAPQSAKGQGDIARIK
jgi:hypothetical protein